MLINYMNILNYLDNRITNASAESFNAKNKKHLGQFRAMRNMDFFSILTNNNFCKILKSHNFWT
ncbi:hypothetical protein [Autumnicola edwardsiae]|uniref:hypothetical protein n=1 Tax=Autumnicola edwardsiae TaxID=3075594 RepID=UPI003D78A0FD